ncbi:MAG: 16S rRNA (cytosine(1402)-N(4))-methyltransferase RsmH [Candidatus Taylorbacteria bacterium]|nr:16S rRNA (cytosine(1402)-N(4))-methyltransferase RsmH [Candidatus Taylorbacteria bacterium]
MIHTSVLLQEVLAGLAIKPDDICLDGTINGGGHSEAIAKYLSEAGTLIGLDLDGAALARAKKRLSKQNANIILKQCSFRNLDTALAEERLPKVDKILLDLGLSSNQLDESGRGFTFRKEEPLTMTFNDTPDETTLTASKIVNTWDAENIEEIIRSYGEEQYAKRIAKAIVEARTAKHIETTTDLTNIIEKAVPASYTHRRVNPATKTFQALRITVNDEIGALQDGLQRGFAHLAPGGRMAIISFHSLEDRIVKRFFKSKAEEGEANILTKRPQIPTEDEIENNPRSRSAKLRIIEKL